MEGMVNSDFSASDEMLSGMPPTDAVRCLSKCVCRRRSMDAARLRDETPLKDCSISWMRTSTLTNSYSEPKRELYLCGEE